jgi:lipoprotein-anchoring transpeptidase ErfK/SrfK
MTTLAQQDGARFAIEALPRTPAELSKRFTAAQVDLLEKLNRRDREHLVRADPPVPGLVVPTVWPDDDLALSPMPHAWIAGQLHAKVIVVHQPWQAFGAYEYGRLVRWGPVSTGRKETPTPAGRFFLTWKARSRRSTDNDAWLLEWYFNFINERGVSFHEFELPGYAASHACVRLLERDAQWLFGWGEQWTLDETRRHVVQPGTPVLIIGEFTASRTPVWTDPAALSASIGLPADIPPAAARLP